MKFPNVISKLRSIDILHFMFEFFISIIFVRLNTDEELLLKKVVENVYKIHVELGQNTYYLIA